MFIICLDDVKAFDKVWRARLYVMLKECGVGGDFGSH